MKHLFILAVILFSVNCLMAQNNSMALNHFYFKVKIDNQEFSFQEVTGFNLDAQAPEYNNGNDKTFSVIKMPGLKKTGNVTCKKGIIPSSQPAKDLLNRIKTNSFKRGPITIELLDEENKIAMTWILANAWIVKTTGMDMNANANEIAIETFEIVHEGISFKK